MSRGCEATTERNSAHLFCSRDLKNILWQVWTWITQQWCAFSSKALTVSIHFVDHVLQFSFCWVLTQWPHDSPKFLCCDGAITIFVEQGESFLEFWKEKFTRISVFTQHCCDTHFPGACQDKLSKLSETTWPLSTEIITTIGLRVWPAHSSPESKHCPGNQFNKATIFYFLKKLAWSYLTWSPSAIWDADLPVTVKSLSCRTS